MRPSIPPHLFTHAIALVAAISVTAVIVDVMAEIGHPPPGGFTVLAMLKPKPSLLAMIGITPATEETERVASRTDRGKGAQER